MAKSNDKIKFFRRSIFSLLIAFTLGLSDLSACEIFFEVIENQKEKYSINDTIVIKANVILTHRICPVGMAHTEFETTGLAIIDEGEWVETDTGMWEKEIKLVVIGTKSGDISITGIRKCEKEGGKGTLKIQSEALKK